MRFLVWLTIMLTRRLLGLLIAIVVFALLGRGPAGRSVLWSIRIMRRITRL